MLTIHSRLLSLDSKHTQCYKTISTTITYKKTCFPLSSFSNLDQKRMENHDGAKLPQNAPLIDSTHVSPILTGWCLGVNMSRKYIST